jgi:hypothetical protein
MANQASLLEALRDVRTSLDAIVQGGLDESTMELLDVLKGKLDGIITMLTPDSTTQVDTRPGLVAEAVVVTPDSTTEIRPH